METCTTTGCGVGSSALAPFVLKAKYKPAANIMHKFFMLPYPSTGVESADGARFFLEATRRLLVVLIGI
jgi:hypothetical protein